MGVSCKRAAMVSQSGHDFLLILPQTRFHRDCECCLSLGHISTCPSSDSSHATAGISLGFIKARNPLNHEKIMYLGRYKNVHVKFSVSESISFTWSYMFLYSEYLRTCI
jgi:hypothetical protein